MFISEIQDITVIKETFGKHKGYFQAYGYPWVFMTMFQSIYLVVMVTWQRYVAVCLPHLASRYASVKAARYQTIALIVIIFIFYLPRLWQREVIYNEETDSYTAGRVSQI